MRRLSCLTPDELKAFQTGDLPEDALAALTEHLESCPQCEAAARALDTLSDPDMVAYRRSARAVPLMDPVALPAQVGDYEILGEVGRGGMGVVYRARHRRLPRTVALKMLLAGTFAQGEERARFKAEAEAVARLQHPNIVQIYEVGEYAADAGLPRPYFTLEFVDGGNLSHHLAGRPQPPRQAAAWVEILARAAHYAHQQGIVHRDLKPSNVLLNADGQPKICDFGVAKLLTGSDIKTLSGMLVGTAEYMAPEQAAGSDKVGPPADIYALGAILYTALTGRPPFQGTSPLHTLDQVRRLEPVSPRRLQPGVPRDLDTICLKCLEKEPARRYATAQALADDLRRFLGDEPIKARRPWLWERCARWVRHHQSATVALAALIGTLAVAAAVSTFMATQESAARRKADQAQELAEHRREVAERNLYAATTNLTGLALDGLGSLIQVAQLLRDWRGLKAAQDPRGWEWFYCQTLAGQAQLTLRNHGADASALAWSPDGRRLASGGFDETLRIWDAATGKQVRAAAAPWGLLSVSWSPDGRRLATANWKDKTVTVWDPATGEQLRTLRGHQAPGYGVAFCPDGRRLASLDEGGHLIVWDVAGGKPVLDLPGRGQGGSALCWSPDGRRLAACDYGNAARVFDAESGRELAVLRNPADPVCALCWSPDGQLLAASGADGTVRLWDAAQYTGLRRLPEARAESCGGTLAWSPDGGSLAVAGRDLAVRVFDVASGALRRTYRGHTGSRIAGVCWSPDGRRLASAERGWNAEIKVWQLDHAPQPRTLDLGEDAKGHLDLAWSPDGRQLAGALRDGTVRLWDAATGGPRASLRGHTGPVQLVRWSPDGSQLASAGRDATVRRWDAATGRLLATYPGGSRSVDWLAWSPDGRQLLVNAKDDKVTFWDVATGTARAAAFRGAGAAWSPDGSRLAVGASYKISLVDAATGQVQTEWATAYVHRNLPVWSPDGRSIAALTDYGVEVWTVATSRPAFAPLVHTQPVRALAWSPDSQQLAVGTADNRVHLWDAITGTPIITLPEDTGPIVAVAWSPDGMRLACSSTAGTVTLWDATPGNESERAAALLPVLDARLAAQPEDAEARRLRAGVHARMGAWDLAAADAARLGAPGFFQAGWWLADATEPGPPSFPPESTVAPRWYCSADDPNGSVPAAKDQPYYLTRVYAPQEQAVEVALERHSKLDARLWANGKPVAGEEPARVPLASGWNTLVVYLEAPPASNILFRPRAGFRLRLSRSAR
jgi:WD40 repeat protein